MVPGAKFSIMMSAFFSISVNISRPREVRRFSVMLRLLAFRSMKYGESKPVLSVDALRPWSPPTGFSTLMMSAPSQARASVHDVPASNCVRSRTLIPANAVLCSMA